MSRDYASIRVRRAVELAPPRLAPWSYRCEGHDERMTGHETRVASEDPEAGSAYRTERVSTGKIRTGASAAARRFLEANPGVWFVPRDVAAAVGRPCDRVSAALIRLAKRGRVELAGEPTRRQYRIARKGE